MEISTHISCFKSNSASATLKVWGRVRLLFRFKKKKINKLKEVNPFKPWTCARSKCIHKFADFILLSLPICVITNTTPCDFSVDKGKRKKKEAERSQNNAASKKWWIKAGDVDSFNKSDYDS